MKKDTYLVTFRNSDDKLTCMFCRTYPNVKDAKTAIELDAEHYLWTHSDEHKTGKKSKRKETYGWVNPESEDYYEVKCQDGRKCVWQYFKI